MRQRLQLAHCWRQAGKRGSSQISLQESNQGPWQLLQLKTLPLMLVPEINCGMPYLEYVKFNAAITELKLRVFYTCIKAKLPPIIFHCSLVESMLPRFAYEKK